ncbi:hypothetical protein F383_31715 [Gossypium arboreum]|uniref:Uncharacterized protein n=2 Tax=Gossypium arboreum TaxID=29729 RepID=A0A0B0PJV0_GOSAR|nr:hypothetical protein F383_31715 [Gossypium arboreum]
MSKFLNLERRQQRGRRNKTENTMNSSYSFSL